MGASLSPTSLGFSAQLLGEVGELSTPMGHLICTAAVIDDVLSLLLLAEVEALEGEDSEVRLCPQGLPVLLKSDGSMWSVSISSCEGSASYSSEHRTVCPVYYSTNIIYKIILTIVGLCYHELTYLATLMCRRVP